ncbi:MAG TPA: hydroxylase [Planctomycetota bacterium]|nr:hydroxylase [Planctomycetota bacterium]
MQVRYLEIVSSDLDATCDALEAIHGVTFSDPVAELGHARTAKLADGNRIGVRAPMQAAETPVVRPYVLVEDIDAAVKAAEAAGATIAHPPLEIPGQGTFAIYFLGGIQHGLWKD